MSYPLLDEPVRGPAKELKRLGDDVAMVIVRPLEDELAEAHAYRHQHIEGYESQVQQIRTLRRRFGIENGISCKYPTTHLLAAVAGKSASDYVRRHTMLPLTAAVRLHAEHIPTSADHWLSSAFHRGFNRTVDDVRICAECLEFDEQQSAFSSYRRRHHLRGTSRCPWHGTRLHAIRGHFPFAARPRDWLAGGQTELVPDIERDVPDARWMRRFTSISMAMLNAEAPISTIDANQMLIERLEDADLSTNIRRPKPLVSDLLTDRAGTRWLTENIPGFGERENGAFVYRIDGFRETPYTLRPSILYAAIWACFDQGDPWTDRARQHQLSDQERSFTRPSPEPRSLSAA